MNNCTNCTRLVRYYTKELKKFNKTEFGWCCEKRKIVCVKDQCEHFERRAYRTKIRFGLEHCLNDLLVQLSTIRQIIEEEKNENKDKKL